MKKAFLILCLFLLFQGIWAEETEEKTSPDEVKINALLPGYYQIKDGREAEGYLYMASLPLMVAGGTLTCLYFINEEFFGNYENFKTVENKHYLWYYDGFESMPNEWMWYTGNVLSVAGSLLLTYSQYDVFCHENRSLPKASPQIGLLDVVTAPWIPANTFNLDVLPVLTLEGGYDVYNIIDSGALKNYFSRDSVSFLGKDMSPGLALASVFLASTAFVSANATWEEIAYRGMRLQADGIHSASINFGLAHAPNALMPNVSVEETIYQTIFATAFGYYAGNITRNNNYDFRRAIAFHFWHNILAFTTNYILEPENNSMFCIQFNYSL